MSPTYLIWGRVGQGGNLYLPGSGRGGGYKPTWLGAGPPLPPVDKHQ